MWEGWSQNREIWFTPKGVEVIPLALPAIPIGRVILENQWQDTISFRLGGQYSLMPDVLWLRGGVFFEQTAVPTQRLSAGSIDLDKVGITAGTKIALPWGMWVDYAVGTTLSIPATVTDTLITLQNPLDPNGGPGDPIGNGEYNNFQVWMQAGLGASLDL